MELRRTRKYKRKLCGVSQSPGFIFLDYSAFGSELAVPAETDQTECSVNELPDCCHEFGLLSSQHCSMEAVIRPQCLISTSPFLLALIGIPSPSARWPTTPSSVQPPSPLAMTPSTLTGPLASLAPLLMGTRVNGNLVPPRLVGSAPWSSVSTAPEIRLTRM